jgi:hypothetical protein
VTEAELSEADGLAQRSPVDLRRLAEDHLEQARLRNPLYERLTSLSAASPDSR